MKMDEELRRKFFLDVKDLSFDKMAAKDLLEIKEARKKET